MVLFWLIDHLFRTLKHLNKEKVSNQSRLLVFTGRNGGKIERFSMLPKILGNIGCFSASNCLKNPGSEMGIQPQQVPNWGHFSLWLLLRGGFLAVGD
jgi:hypothetical protein